MQQLQRRTRRTQIDSDAEDSEIEQDQQLDNRQVHTQAVGFIHVITLIDEY